VPKARYAQGGRVLKKVVVLGSTGSIGRISLEVLEDFPERFSIVGLSAGRNAGLLYEQALRYRPQVVALDDESLASDLAERLATFNVKVLGGPDGLAEIAGFPGSDLVVNALVGAVGLIPTLKAIESGKTVALANKEALVMAGGIITEKAREYGTDLIPIDSEMSAIWQCLHSCQPTQIRRLILTASGGPFLNLPKEEFQRVRPSDALMHPTWQMGKKITVDSATLMNKGLEVIEAHWFFNMPPSKIDVVIHPQSVVHSLVELVDGSIRAQLSVPDMRLPVQYALTFPERFESCTQKMDFSSNMMLSFSPPDLEKFGALRLAYSAASSGGTMPAVLNAANEVAVEAFLEERLPFTSILKVVERAMEEHPVIAKPSLDDILGADSWARREAERLVRLES